MTWWSLLVTIRKGFVILNALIGVYATFKMTGFSTDNLFGGFIAVGHTYLEMLIYGTKRLFYWLYFFLITEFILNHLWNLTGKYGNEVVTLMIIDQLTIIF